MFSLFLSGCWGTKTVDGDGDLHNQVKINPPPVGPFSINGVKIGMTYEQVETRLGGKPTQGPLGKNKPSFRWGPKQFSATFDKHPGGKVIGMGGQTLEDGKGKVLVSIGSNEAYVGANLKGAVIQKSYGPTGSGVISFGQKLTGTNYTLKDSTGEFSVTLYKGDNVTGIIGQKLR